MSARERERGGVARARERERGGVATGGRSRLAVCLLSTYAVLLVLSAWPESLRSPWLSGPAGAARSLLGSVGIRGGLAVFQPPRTRIEKIQRNDCVWVSGLRADAEPVLLHPPEGRCPLSGFRPRIPWMEMALRYLLLRAPTPLNQAAIGDFFCHREGSAPRFEAVEVLWTQPWLDRRSGREGRQNVVLYRWRCAPPAIEFELRAPSDAELVQSARGVLPPGRAVP